MKKLMKLVLSALCLVVGAGLTYAVFGEEGGYTAPEETITDQCLIAFQHGVSNMSVVWTSGDGSVSNVVTGQIKGTYVPRGSENVRIICTANPGYELIGERVFELGTVESDITFGIGNDYRFPDAVNSTVNVVYQDWDEANGRMTNAVARAGRWKAAESSDMAYALKGCVVVTNDVTILIAQVVGDAVLVLCNDATLTVTGAGDEAGIHVPTNASLTITVRKGSTGRVVAQGGADCAGIGSQFKQGSGSVLGAVRIVAGAVTAVGGYGAENIGCGEGTESGTVQVSGGIFWAKPKDGWLATARSAVPNMDPVTADAYPWRVVESKIVVRPGSPMGPFLTAEEATNAWASVEFVPSEEVAGVLTTGLARSRYAGWFDFDITSKDVNEWYVEAVLSDAAKTRLAETATKATRQIPVAEIAARPESAPYRKQGRRMGRISLAWMGG